MKTIRMMTWPVWAATALMMSTTVQAANTKLDVSWEVAQSSCEIDAPTELDLGVVDVTTILSSGWQSVGQKDLTITINDCNGGYTPGAGSRPSVQVLGQTAQVGTWQSLFKYDGDSVGLYIILRKAEKPAGSNPADNEVKNGETLWIPATPGAKTYVPAGGVLAPDTDYKITLTAGVTCGPPDATGCKNPNIRAGELGAMFTFVFDYR